MAIQSIELVNYFVLVLLYVILYSISKGLAISLLSPLITIGFTPAIPAYGRWSPTAL